jgi:hypothetical protein
MFPAHNAWGLPHLAITVGSENLVNTLSKRLHHDGYEVIDGPRRTGDGYYESVVLDPDGNRNRDCCLRPRSALSRERARPRSRPSKRGSEPDLSFRAGAHWRHLAEVAPGVFWLRMPLPFALDHINLWVLRDNGGWTLVDTGLNTDATRGLWDHIVSDGLAVSRCCGDRYSLSPGPLRPSRLAHTALWGGVVDDRNRVLYGAKWYLRSCRTHQRILTRALRSARSERRATGGRAQSQTLTGRRSASPRSASAACSTAMG